MLWTAGQRTTLAAIILIVVGLLGVRAYLNPTAVADPPPDRAALADQLQDRIDPNAADEATLAALPGIGPAMAGRIVAYRDERVRERPDGVVFRSLDDLEPVRGIGPAMLENLEPHLRFPDRPEGGR